MPQINMELSLENIDPKLLTPNSWNSNYVDEDHAKKLDNSLNRLGNFKPILVRELQNGTLEIIGGQHRTASAIRRNIKTVPVLNLGTVDDAKAKEMSLVDNERYGEDDTEELKKLLDGLGSTSELASFLPMSTEDLDSLFSYDSIDLDELDVEDDDELPIEKPTPSSPTHRVVRFKVAVEDAEHLSEFLETVKKNNGFTGSDELTNAGDSLIHTLKEIW